MNNNKNTTSNSISNNTLNNNTNKQTSQPSIQNTNFLQDLQEYDEKWKNFNIKGIKKNLYDESDIQSKLIKTGLYKENLLLDVKENENKLKNLEIQEEEVNKLVSNVELQSKLENLKKIKEEKLEELKKTKNNVSFY